MKENKITRLEVRLTEAEKQKIKDYAAEHNKTVSTVIRELCQFIFEQ